MLNSILLTALLATPGLAPIAAVEKAAVKAKFEELWESLSKPEPEATRAAIKLYTLGKDVVPLIQAKMRPLKLEIDDCNALIKKLGSDDESTWKAAWKELDYLDPRLAIDLETLMNTVKENPARNRLVEVMCGQVQGALSGKTIQLSSIGGGNFNFRSNNSSWWAEHRVEKIGNGGYKTAWMPIVRAMAVLQELGTPDAIKLLEAFATGHPDAGPVKAAAASLKAMRAK